MQYTIVAGDNLSAIGRRHGVSLEAILELNPTLRSNPDRISVGQIIVLPDGGAASPPANPSPGPTPVPRPAPNPASGWVLGGLSTKYETGSRGSTTVSGGAGDAGGISYGSYQMTSVNGGTVGRFVSQPDFPWRGEFSGLTPGSPEFTAKWKEIANRVPVEFKNAEHEYIKRTHFDPLCRKIQTEDDVDIARCAHAVQDVIWSTAVQHGGATDVVHLAFAQMRAVGTFDPASTEFERNVISAIYAERGRKDASGTLMHFSRNSQAVQNGVAARFVSEAADALRLLDAGT